MINLINCTPHSITVTDMNGLETTFQPSGMVARVEMNTQTVGNVDGFELTKNVVGSVTGIPNEIEENTFYIVSAMVLANSNRTDLVAPDTNRAVRNDRGHIVSVPGFVIN